MVDGLAHAQVARLLPNGKLDVTFDVSVSSLDSGGYVQAVALDSMQRLLLAGFFRHVNGVPRSGIARLNADGTVDGSFDWPPERSETIPRWGMAVLEQPNGQVLVAARIDDGSGLTQPQVVRLNADGRRDTTFGRVQLMPTCGCESDARVEAMAVQSDDDILVGGSFSSIGAEPISGLARLFGNPASVHSVQFAAPAFAVDENGGSAHITLLRNGDTSAPLSVDFAEGTGSATAGIDFDPVRLTVIFAPLEVTETVSIPVLDNSRVDGNRSVSLILTNPSAGAVLAHNSATLTIRDNEYPSLVDPSFDPGLGADGAVASVAIQVDGKILIAGDFTHVAAVARPYLARLNANGSLDTSFTPKPNAELRGVLVQPDGRIVCWGYGLMTMNGVSRTGIARLNPDGTLDTAFKPATNPSLALDAVALQPDGKILLAGIGSMVLGANRTALARLNEDGGTDKTFDAYIGPANAWLHALLVQSDGKIIVAGTFNSVHGTRRQNLARLDPDDTLDPSFEARSFSFAPYLTALAMDVSNRLVAIDGESSDPGPVIRLQPDGTLDTSFDSGLRDPASGGLVLAPDGSVFFGGTFYPNNASYQRIGRVTPEGSLDPAFQADFASTNLMPADIRAVVRQPDGKVLVGGRFHQVNGFPRNGIVRFYTNGSGPVGFAMVSAEDAMVESASGISFTVKRLGNSSGPATVGYEIQSADPSAGFAPVKGLVSYADLEVSKVVNVPLPRRASEHTDTLLRITLEDPNSGLALADGPFTELIRLVEPERPGGIDLTFDSNLAIGLSTSEPDSGIDAIAVLSNGKIIVAGTGLGNQDGNAKVMRLNPDGSPDPAFAPLTVAEWAPTSLAAQPDGKIFVTDGTQLRRVNLDGTTDNSFNVDFQDSTYTALALQPDGRWIDRYQLHRRRYLHR
jgi:uncharacterized delta-60 repeat protein